MHNVGEEIVGEWLRHFRGCPFVAYNVPTTESQGEIDVVAIDPFKKTLFVCEVCVHLTTGVQYVGRSGEVDNVSRFIAKFGKGVAYAKSGFPDYQHVFMLWSPIAKQKKNPATCQVRQLGSVKEQLAATLGVELELVLNEAFARCRSELREFAGAETKELKSPVLRLMQIEEYLKKAERRRRKSEKSTDANS
jgi:hypothetical protein